MGFGLRNHQTSHPNIFFLFLIFKVSCSILFDINHILNHLCPLERVFYFTVTNISTRFDIP